MNAKLTWNYRLVKHVDQGRTYYALHEVHYTSERTLIGLTPATGYHDSKQDLIQDLQMMVADAKRCKRAIPFK